MSPSIRDDRFDVRYKNIVPSSTLTTAEVNQKCQLTRSMAVFDVERCGGMWSDVISYYWRCETLLILGWSKPSAMASLTKL